MRLLCVDHKDIFGGGQVALLNAFAEWQVLRVDIQARVVCSPRSALASRTRALGVACVEMELGAIEKTRGVLWNMAQRVAPTRALLAQIREFQPDTLLANGAYSFLACAFAAKLARVPVVWYEHNITLPNGWLLRRLIRNARAIVVVSETIRKQFLNLMPDASAKMSVIYNGVALQDFCTESVMAHMVKESFGWNQATRVVGTVSRMSPEKNVALFLNAAANITRSMPDVKFLVVGDGPERAQLQTRFQDERVVFTGQRADVPRLLQAMDVFVLSSNTEAFSLAIVEAMAARRAVVATDVGGVREALNGEECGRLIPPQDAEALADVVLELLRDQDTRSVLGERAFARVARHFTRAQQATQLNMILQSSKRIKPKHG